MEPGSDKHCIEKVLAGNVNAFSCLVEAHKTRPLTLLSGFAGTGKRPRRLPRMLFSRLTNRSAISG
ncbi:MAG TPA: hypothetical protein DCY25_05355 [Bacteroidales bacterium]|nr:hypothetical protein [Bacteroidales bacterium]